MKGDVVGTTTKGKIGLMVLLVCAAVGAHATGVFDFDLPAPGRSSERGETIELYVSSTASTVTVDAVIKDDHGSVVYTTQGPGRRRPPYTWAMPVPEGRTYTAVIHAGVEYDGDPAGISCHVSAGTGKIAVSDVTVKEEGSDYPDIFCRGSVTNA